MNPESRANNKPPRSPSAANNNNMMLPTTAAENAAIDAAIDLIMGHQESDNDDDNDTTTTTHSNSVVSGYNDYRSQRKHRTLKGRIKRTMAMNEEESSFLAATTTATTTSRSADSCSCTVPTTAMSTSNTNSSGGSGGRSEAESVLAAASTLASLGVTSPTSTSSTKNRPNIMFSDMHQRVMSLGTNSYPQTSFVSAASSAPAPSSLPANTTRAVPSSILPTSTTISGTTTISALPFSNVLSLIQPPPSLSTTVSTPVGVANDTTAETTTNNMVLAPAPPPPAANQNSNTTNAMFAGLAAATATAVAPASNTVGVGARRSGFDNRNNNIAAPQEEVSIGRPFASLLGSDIPLTFPQKLMEVLSNPQISDIITWLPHGNGFIILQKRKFAMDVMPLYFKHSKFTSFTRKLNRWGFSRVSRGPEMGAYYHKYFQRGNYLMCMQMHCQSTNKSSSAAKTKESPKEDKVDTDMIEDRAPTPPSIANTTNDTAAESSSQEASSSSVSSPRIKASLTVRSGMHTLKLNGGTNAKSRASPMNPVLPLVAERRNALSTLLKTSVTDYGNKNNKDTAFSKAAASSCSSSSAARNASAIMANSPGGGTLSGFVQHQQGNIASFDRALNRQQEILHQGQVVVQHQQQRQQPQQHQAPRLHQVRSQGGSSVQQVNQFQQQGPSPMRTSVFPQSSARQVNMQQPHSILKSCMKQQQPMQSQSQQTGSVQQQQSPAIRQSPSMQQQPLSQQRPHSNTPIAGHQSLASPSLLDVNTASSQSHPIVINNALAALKSCNDQAFLTALMTKEHTKGTSAVSGGGPADSGLSTYQIQSHIHAAMQAQLRQLGEYQKEQNHQDNNRSTSAGLSAQQCSLQQRQVQQQQQQQQQQQGVQIRSIQQQNTNSTIPPSSTTASGAQESVHAAMLAQMRQLDKSNQQLLIDMSTLKSSSSNMKSNIHSHTMPQSNVAQIYSQIRQHNNSGNGVPSVPASHVGGNDNNGGDGGQLPPKRRFHRAVRRASAA